MNWRAIGNLMKLRYKLMWAKTRSRTGKIALFLIGLLSYQLLLALVSAGGIGAAVVAVRSGKAEEMAQILLSGLFLNAVFASVLLGFGVSAAFTDAELRRYPLPRLERFTVQHIIGFVDPFWLLFLAIGSGLVVGLSIWGSYSLVSGGVALLLFFFCTYSFTRALNIWMDQLLEARSGYVVVFALMMLIGFAPAMLLANFQSNRAFFQRILPVLRFTPPFGAATAVTHQGSEGLFGLAVLAGWLVVLAAVITFLEHRRVSWKQTVPASDSHVPWPSPLDVVAAIFGRQMAPLVACWLRFYLRNKRFRLLSIMTLPVVGIFSLYTGQPRHGGSIFFGVLGCLPVVTFIATSRIAVNQYGYASGGLRRLCLLPVDHGSTLRAGNFAALLLGAAWIPPVSVLWALLAPHPLDPRMVVMPVINAFTALFLFHGFGLWTSIYAPKRGSYDKTFGPDMSAWGYIVFLGLLWGCMLIPMALRSVAPWAMYPSNWRLTLPGACIATIFYFASLRYAPRAVPGRREVLLAIVEGKGN